MLIDENELLEDLQRYIINDCDKNFIYGTSGFRTCGKRLFGIAYRIGILSVLRSMEEQGAVIGVMVTASHNKASDNGLKVIDKGGEMLRESWEDVAVEFTKVSEDNVLRFIKEVCESRKIDLSVQGSVFLGEDNRITSSKISRIIAQGVKIVSGKCIDFGKVTTPQLHFLVRKQNAFRTNLTLSNLDCYFHQLCNSFVKLRCNKEQSLISPLYVDCANGVGAQHLSIIKSKLKCHMNNLFICNSNPHGEIINLQCGADYIKTTQTFPIIHNGDVLEISENQRWASIDGDADRLIYFFKKNEILYILDGDKQAVIIAEYIKAQLETLPDWSASGLKLGVVQTAYANHNCTQIIIDNIGVPITCVPTGVKYLHHVGKEFDIRIYFEANGHGSIILSSSAKEFLLNKLDADHALRFILLDGIINEAVGDSFSILLLIEHILLERHLSLDSWYNLYCDLPSCLLQVKIKDRRIISTTDAERIVLQPKTLQNDIDKKIKEISNGNKSRAFVRPSGTEDIVRVYAECDTQNGATHLALEVARLVFDQVGGVGDRP